MSTQTPRRDDLLARTRALDVGDVADRIQVERYPRERNKYRCPLCSTGALHVYREGPAYCHACAKPMNALDLAIAHTGMGIREAGEMLAALYGITPDVAAPYIAPRPHRVATPARAAAAPHHQGGEEEERGVCDQWGSHEAAIAELAQRRLPAHITRAAGITHVTQEDWRAHLATMSAARAQERGYIRWSEKRGCMKQLLWAFPALRLPYQGFDPGERPQERFGLLGEARERDPRKYVSPYALPVTVPFGADTLRELGPADTLYLLEGEINALSLRAIGLRAISCSGSGTWCEEWAAPLRRAARLVLVLDGDEAAARQWAGPIVESLDLQWGAQTCAQRVTAISCPKGRDANDLLRAGVLGRYLEAGTWRATMERSLAVRVASSLFPLLSSLRPGERSEAELVAGVRAALAWWDGAAVAQLLDAGGHVSAWQAIHEEGLGQPVGACAYGRLQWYVDEVLRAGE